MDFKKIKNFFVKEKEEEKARVGSVEPRSGVESAVIQDALKVESLMKDSEHDEKIEQLEKGILPSGATVDRPSSPVIGQSFFDTDLGKAIIYNGSNWINFDGTSL